MPSRQISIWFFIGVLLLVYGLLVTGAGIAQWMHPAPVVLARLHAGVWWGLCLTLAGGAYCLRFRPR